MDSVLIFGLHSEDMLLSDNAGKYYFFWVAEK
jgi:hypothetical protein